MGSPSPVDPHMHIQAALTELSGLFKKKKDEVRRTIERM